MRRSPRSSSFSNPHTSCLKMRSTTLSCPLSARRRSSDWSASSMARRSAPRGPSSGCRAIPREGSGSSRCRAPSTTHSSRPRVPISRRCSGAPDPRGDTRIPTSEMMGARRSKTRCACTIAIACASPTTISIPIADCASLSRASRVRNDPSSRRRSQIAASRSIQAS